MIRRKAGVLLLKFVSVFLFLPPAPKKSLRHVSCVPPSNIKALLECTEVAALPVLQYFQPHANQEVTTSSPSYLDWPHGSAFYKQKQLRWKNKAVTFSFSMNPDVFYDYCARIITIFLMRPKSLLIHFQTRVTRLYVEPHATFPERKLWQLEKQYYHKKMFSQFAYCGACEGKGCLL